MTELAHLLVDQLLQFFRRGLRAGEDVNESLVRALEDYTSQLKQRHDFLTEVNQFQHLVMDEMNASVKRTKNLFTSLGAVLQGTVLEVLRNATSAGLMAAQKTTGMSQVSITHIGHSNTDGRSENCP